MYTLEVAKYISTFKKNAQCERQGQEEIAWDIHLNNIYRELWNSMLFRSDLLALERPI